MSQNMPCLKWIKVADILSEDPPITSEIDSGGCRKRHGLNAAAASSSSSVLKAVEVRLEILHSTAFLNSRGLK